MTAERVIVVGAGLTGLAVAARLLHAGRDVLVLEASARAGGQIHTLRRDDLVVELGAEGFVARSRAVPALCELLGIDAELVDQRTTDTYAVEASGLVLLPAGEAARRLGFQVPAEELGRGIRSLSAGMGQLIDALQERVGSARIRLGTPAASLRAASGSLWVEAEPAQAVVLAVPARAAAALLRSHSPNASSELERAKLLSNVSVNLRYGANQFRDYPSGSGLIFPESFAAVGLRAVSLVDHKFDGRAPAGQALLRVFFRPIGVAQDFRDEQFVAEAARAIAGVLSVSGEPAEAWVSRWDDALPVYTSEFRESLAGVDPALQEHGIHLAGSAFHGAGIDAAVASAERVAARLCP